MRKAFAVAVLLLFGFSASYATLVSNINQSVQFVRMLARNASTDLDAVFYNPAGLAKLDNGWHLALHIQTIGQTKTIISGYPLLNDGEYVGDLSAPVFPDVYLVYKKDRLAVSFGFMPSAGGGVADYKTGLPSFEMGFSQLPLLISSMGLPTTAYSADIAFKGGSMFLGFQVNASYALSDQFSFSVGARYNMASNNYEGSITNVMINPGHPLINPTAAMIPATNFFTMIGQPYYAALVADKSVDAKQTGSGITPIVGVNISPTDRFNIGVRYEFNTKIELENDTTRDDTGMFPDGEKSRNDIPAILAVGASYLLTPKLRVSLAYDMYFDQNADWDGNEDNVDSNSYDLALGLEYNLTERLLVSAGYSFTKVDLADGYMTDMGYDLSSNTYGFGLRYTLSRSLDLDLGALYSKCPDDTRSFTDATVGSYSSTFQKNAWDVAAGLGIHF